MKLTLTLNELESGSVAVSGTQDRRTEAAFLGRRREPISINPITMRDGKRISAICPTGEVMESQSPVISFRPIWCKLFTVNSMKKDSLTRIVVEFEFGKYMIDVNGVHETKPPGLTTSGPGTDPKVVSESEITLGKFLEAPRTNDLIFHLISLIQRSF